LAPVRHATPASAAPPLSGATITIEYNARLDRAALIVEAECDEALARIQLHAPDGAKILDLNAGPGQHMLLSGVRLESDEPQLDALLGAYPEGNYQIRAQTPDGRRLLGRATLSHTLVRPPSMVFPRQGFVGVPTTGLRLTWTGNVAANGYEVALEQGDNDGLRIKLPPGSTSFLVPDGFLAAATPTQLEIAALAANGNRTVTAIEFTTQ
jgi:hypothetical protein